MQVSTSTRNGSSASKKYRSASKHTTGRKNLDCAIGYKRVVLCNGLRLTDTYQSVTKGTRAQAGESTHPPALRRVGVLGKPHGLKGEIKLQKQAVGAERCLEEYARRGWYVAAGDAEDSGTRHVHLESCRKGVFKQQPSWILQFRDVNSCDAASGLRGSELLCSSSEDDGVDAANAPGREGGSLVGMAASCAESGEAWGVVIASFQGTGTYDTVEIELCEFRGGLPPSSPNLRSFLLPCAPACIARVDFEAGKILVDVPPVLVDLAQVRARA